MLGHFHLPQIQVMHSYSPRKSIRTSVCNILNREILLDCEENYMAKFRISTVSD